MRDSYLTRAGLMLGALLIVLGLLLTAAADAQNASPADDAVLEVFVFEGGHPVPGLTLRAGDLSGTTNASGAWEAEVQPGETRLTVFDGAQALTALPMRFSPGEIAQVIITLTGEERRAQVSVSSSHSVERRPAAGQARQEQQQQSAGEGELVGRVVSTEDGAPITDARIFVSGTPVQARTDDDGRFAVTVPAGEYSVSVLHGEYATRTVDGVVVENDEATTRDFELPPAGLELAEYVVTVPYIEGSITSVIDEQRQTASVANVLGAEQISRAGDSDVANALSRVTGLTLVDGQFIYIRGLGERYSSTLVNGANVPSPDPTRKVVPLDLFPTGVIRSILVQKGYSPEMPGDFGGGVVEIRTRGIPEEDFFAIELSAGYRAGTTFDEGLTYEGGDRDFSGFDDGTRDIPEPVAGVIAGGVKIPPVRTPFTPDGITEEELERLGESFPTIYDVDEKEPGPDRGVSIEGGKRFTFADGWSAGITGSILWDDSWRSRTELRRTFIPLGDGSLRPNDDYTIERTTRTIGLSGFLTAGIDYGDLHALDLTSMLLRQTEDEATRQIGFNLDEDGIVKFNELEWEERQLIANQAEGRHVFPFLNSARLEWDYSESRAELYEPDNRRYRFDPDPESEFIFSRRADSNIRRYTFLDDKAVDFGGDLFVPFELSGWLEAELSGGFRSTEKSRSSIIRRFAFDDIGNIPFDVRRRQSLEDILIPEFIGPDGAQIVELTDDGDNYTASLDIEAFYGNLDFTIADTVRIAGGVRVEDWSQDVRTFSLFDPDRVSSVSELGDQDLFPAASLTWLISDRQQVRFSYAETIIRPDFKELSTSVFTDPILERVVQGNADLVPSDVRHFDLRWEFYPSPSELLSVGAFYKLIDQPVELTVEPGVEQRLTFENADEAVNFGVEFEGRKTLEFVDEWFGWSGVLEPFFVAGNVSIIESEITIDPEDRGILTSTSRELQGQSPLIVNAQVGYDRPDLGLEATVLYNFVGERIVEVGVLGAPDKVEAGAGQLDVVVRWKWSDHWRAKLKLGNLLDAEFRIEQGPKTTQQYSNGRTLGIGIEYSFL
ncbi:MAG: TonB-dependent receptor domain-containing protein [Candidatus Wenzhouxiangella sp. M2_3B_020]